MADTSETDPPDVAQATDETGDIEDDDEHIRVRVHAPPELRVAHMPARNVYEMQMNSSRKPLGTSNRETGRRPLQRIRQP